MAEKDKNGNEDNNKKEKLVEDPERESDIKLDRITDNTLVKIEEIKNGPHPKKVNSIQTILSIWNTMI